VISSYKSIQITSVVLIFTPVLSFLSPTLLVNEDQQIRTQSQSEAYTRRKLRRVPGHERFLPNGWSWRGMVVALSRMITQGGGNFPLFCSLTRMMLVCYSRCQVREDEEPNTMNDLVGEFPICLFLFFLPFSIVGFLFISLLFSWSATVTTR
jgi:hypothetical protein